MKRKDGERERESREGVSVWEAVVGHEEGEARKKTKGSEDHGEG